MTHKLNKITLPIIMIVTFIFSSIKLIERVIEANYIEHLGIFIQTTLIIGVAFLTYRKKMYASSIVILSFKLLFIEGQVFMKMLLSNHQPDFKTITPYFNIWAMVMLFYLPFLLINTLLKDKKPITTKPHKKFINVSSMFIFLVLFVGPEAALFAVIPAFVCLLFNLRLEPDMLFLAAVINIPFQMINYMLDATKPITLFHALYWMIGIIYVVYGLFITTNTIIKILDKTDQFSVDRA